MGCEQNRPAIIFFDVDGTLALHGHAPSPKTAEGVRRLREQGHLAVLCTGRPPCGIGQSIWHLGFQGVIALAGAYVRAGNEVIRQSTIPPALMRETAERLLAAGVCCLLESAEFCCALGPSRRGMFREVRRVSTFQQFCRDYPEPPFAKIVIPGEELPKLERERELLLGSYTLSHIGAGFGELSPKGVHKGLGVRTLLAHWGRGRERTFGIGDSENDLAMFRAVETSVVMGGAAPEVRRQGDYVTAAVEEEGVYRALEHFRLI